MVNLLTKIEGIFRKEPLDHPFVPVVKKPVVKNKAPEKKPDNIVYDAGQRAYTRIETPDGFEDNIWTGVSGQRSETMTDRDFKMVKERRLKETVYRELKPYWAAEYSAAKMSKQMKGKRGYSQRSVENYWSAMNAAAIPLPSSK